MDKEVLTVKKREKLDVFYAVLWTLKEKVNSKGQSFSYGQIYRKQPRDFTVMIAKNISAFAEGPVVNTRKISI